MPEIALVTAGLGLCFGVAAVLLDRATSIRLERVAAKQLDLDNSVDVCSAAIGKITVELPESRVIQMEGTCRALKEQYDTMVDAFEKHRGQCHRSMQRFDQIMRRDERAAKVITDAQKAEGDGLEVEPADETETAPMTQEGDRSFLENTTHAGADLGTPAVAAQSWDDRRRAMQREYHANRAGPQTVTIAAGRHPKQTQ